MWLERSTARYHEFVEAARFRWARFLERKGHHLRASAVWRRIAEGFEPTPRARIEMARTAIDERSYGLALALLDPASPVYAEEAAGSKLDGIRSRLLLRAVREGAALALADGRYETAALLYDRLLSLSPDHPWAARLRDQAWGQAPAFARRLRKTKPNVDTRLFVAGCGRSGTWMLTAMLTGLKGAVLEEGENDVGRFMALPNESGLQIVKRQHDSYKRFAKLPSDIAVIYIVRHPLDVLTSTHLGETGHIDLERLEGEMRAYFTYLQDRPRTLSLRFEDLVREPQLVQKRVEAFLGVEADVNFGDFHENAALPAYVVESMHGLRKPDPTRLEAWRRKPEAVAEIMSRLAASDGTLDKAVRHFGYEMPVSAITASRTV